MYQVVAFSCGSKKGSIEGVEVKMTGRKEEGQGHRGAESHVMFGQKMEKQEKKLEKM